MTEQCPTCKSELEFSITTNSVHYGRLDCSSCQKFIKWVRNPDTKQRNRTKTSSSKIPDILKFHNYEKEFCFFCLREREQLGWSETMTIDHIVELDKGGKDEIGNLQILCSACHKLKNWARLYLHWHLKKGDEKDGGDSKTII